MGTSLGAAIYGCRGLLKCLPTLLYVSDALTLLSPISRLLLAQRIFARKQVPGCYCFLFSELPHQITSMHFKITCCYLPSQHNISYFSPWSFGLQLPVQLDLNLYKLHLIVTLLFFHLSAQNSSLAYVSSEPKKNTSFSVAQQLPLLHPSLQSLQFGKSNVAFTFLCKRTHQLPKINDPNYLNLSHYQPFNYYSLTYVSEVTCMQYFQDRVQWAE